MGFCPLGMYLGLVWEPNEVWEVEVWRPPNLMKLEYAKLQFEWNLRNWGLYGYKPQFPFNLKGNLIFRNSIAKLGLIYWHAPFVGWGLFISPSD